MTNQLALEILQSHRSTIDHFPIVKSALDWAIVALERDIESDEEFENLLEWTKLQVKESEKR